MGHGGLRDILFRLFQLAVAWWPTVVVSVILATPFLWAIWWLWWRLPQRMMRSITASQPRKRADIADNFRKTVGQALGGVAVLAGAVFAYLQFIQQQNANHEQLVTNQKSAEDLRISNQISKGFEQLVGDKMEMRLGGIYALEGVMRISPEYRQSVLSGLCAFVRIHTTGVPPETPREDVAAILGVIGSDFGIVDLHGANIPNAIMAWAKLASANLSGADLRGANLNKATLDNASMGDIHVEHASLVGANLQGANLENAHMEDADLKYARLDSAVMRLPIWSGLI